MATMRVPRPEVAAAQYITIDSTLTPSPQACIIGNGQQVSFINNSGSEIYLSFQPDATPNTTVFNNASISGGVPPPNNWNTQTPQVDDRTVNYAITTNNNPTSYPYAIQVGDGPLYVLVTYSGSAVQCYPSPAVIPVDGTIEFYKNSNDSNSYPVAWAAANGDPFDPAISSVDGASHTDTGAENTYTYTVTKVGLGGGTGHGGGTVIIKGT